MKDFTYNIYALRVLNNDDIDNDFFVWGFYLTIVEIKDELKEAFGFELANCHPDDYADLVFDLEGLGWSDITGFAKIEKVKVVLPFEDEQLKLLQ